MKPKRIQPISTMMRLMVLRQKRANVWVIQPETIAQRKRVVVVNPADVSVQWSTSRQGKDLAQRSTRMRRVWNPERILSKTPRSAWDYIIGRAKEAKFINIPSISGMEWEDEFDEQWMKRAWRGSISAILWRLDSIMNWPTKQLCDVGAGCRIFQSIPLIIFPDWRWRLWIHWINALHSWRNTLVGDAWAKRRAMFPWRAETLGETKEFHRWWWLPSRCQTQCIEWILHAAREKAGISTCIKSGAYREDWVGRSEKKQSRFLEEKK